MNHHIRILLLLWSVGCLGLSLQAQNINCGSGTVSDTSSYIGSIAGNYGSITNSVNNKYSVTGSLGESFIGGFYGQSYQSVSGYYSSFLLPPSPPIVTATQGDLLDRIQLNWDLDPLSPSASEGFNIYRDGIFLANVGNSVRTYNDFNVIAGRPYNYTVRGVNTFGEGFSGHALGFQVPNGVVTGWVQSPSGNPVPDAVVTLTPMQGFSAKFGPSDGAFADTSMSGQQSFLPAPGEPWSFTFWIQTDVATSYAGIMVLNPLILGIPIESATGQEGISFYVNGPDPLVAYFPDSTKNGWHHVALTSDGEQYRLYLDAVLTAFIPAPPSQDVTALNFGALTGLPGTWQGRLDEVRIYHRLLDELDFDQVKGGTASSLTPGLKYYWKMDEEQGTKSFDLIRRHQLYFCGASFDTDRPPVHIAGVTNEEGYYRIESASYGTGTTFLAKASKNFYAHRALKFESGMADYAALPDFSLTSKSTIEIWANSTGLDAEKVLLHKRWNGNTFTLSLADLGGITEVLIDCNGNTHTYGSIPSMGYQHLAVTIDSSGNDRIMTAYANGSILGSFTFNGVTGNWSDPSEMWYVGGKVGTPSPNYFNGLIDEIAVYDTILPAATIAQHVQKSRDPQEAGLRIYFPFDEGNGARLNNIGSVLTGPGQVSGTEWSPFAPNQSTKPHIFTPGSRQVTLNPSITSVDQVDFVDRSTVPVSGFVRYANTDCFAPNVEILVNGASYNPAIYSDSTGKFVVDFDPGTTATLTPKLANHQFIPAFEEVVNVVNPIAGILFNDVTTRKVSGQVVGGLCKKSVIKAPPGQGQGTYCIVKVRSADGCLERQILIDNQEGEYEFLNLPPLESLTVAVTEHSDPKIKTAFQVQGGSTVNLSKKDTLINFVYFAPPHVEISGLDPFGPDCSTIVLGQDEVITVEIKLVEKYVATPTDDGICPLDTAGFRILNGFSDTVLDTAMSGGLLKYKFRVGAPNPSPPYLKFFQVIGTSLAGVPGSRTEEAVVTGIRNKLNTFTTQLPEVPILILRDPPGDGSYSYWEKNNKACTTIKSYLESSTGGGAGSTVDNGPDVKITFPTGGPIIETETKIGLSISGTVSYKKVEDNSFEVCLSSTERIATSDGDQIVGEDADVYVGLGTNISVGFADEVTFNDTICQPAVKELITVEPLSATTFMYSQFHIKNNVIRYLDNIINNDTLQLDSATLADYMKSKVLWEQFLKDNDTLKLRSEFLKNLSFDSGVTYEYSETSDTSINNSISEYINSEGAERSFIGGSVAGIGVEADIKFVFSDSKGTKLEDTGKEAGITTGYVLADDDPGDAFTVDVAMDTVYKTPVFGLVAGQSSCPWEEGTANREAPNLALASGSQFKAVNVPANEAAVFKMNIGNLSATNEDWTYGISAIAASNPHGAVIKLNGAVLNSTQRFVVPYGTSIPITITVERGPVEYEYDSLKVALYSECEYERDFALSLGNNPMFFSPIYLGVDFIRPCSEVEINVPEQDWVIFPDPLTPGPDDLRRITVSGYDTLVTDFQLVRLQYRRSDGDGSWINIADTSDRYNPNWSGYAALPDPKPPVLQADFTQFYWNSVGLSDGPYEIRAVAVCSGDASGRPGYSQVIKGRIDREPPSLVGTPQPSDGVYNVGDEISFTFNKHINCGSLIPANDMMPNNVGLYDATTGQLIFINVTCFENKIILDPTFLNSEFENHILRAELHDIKDKTGNKSTFIKWEFFVDRNELAWLTDSLGMTKYEDDTRTVSASIHNRGGYPVPFEITGVPAWVRVVPDKGTMVPNEIRNISFEVDSSLAFGHWSDTIVLTTAPGQNPNFFMGGDEPLPFGVRVVCRPPDWNLNAGLFENTMNFVLELNIEGEKSSDVEDIVAAFIGDTLCGRAKVQYVTALDKYLVYLTVYGNPYHAGLPVRFEIWDASACLRFGEVLEVFNFQPDNVVGITDIPEELHTTSLVLREIPLGFGWNWLSFNLKFPDNGINSALNLIKNPNGDLVKSQTQLASNLGGSWFGSLNSLSNLSMYIYQTNQPDTLKILGTVIDPATTSIPLTAGWNWVGYIPNYALPVNDALASVPAQTGDLIKGQYSFAQYINPTYGWLGNLKYMAPPNGYQLRLSQPGTLTYPPAPVPFTGDGIKQRGDPKQHVTSYWTVDNPAQYEFNMTVIGMFSENNMNATTAMMELGAFVGNEVRGSAQAIYIEPLQAYMFFLTIYSNTIGEAIQFKLYNGDTNPGDDVAALSEVLNFAPNQNFGSLEDPYPLTLLPVGTSNPQTFSFFEVLPNPFNDVATLVFSSNSYQEVQVLICDALGRTVLHKAVDAVPGRNMVHWQSNSVEPGVYYIQLKTLEGSAVCKVIKE